MIDSLIHTLVYSHLPLFILQENPQLFVFFFDTPDRAQWRWVIHAGFAFGYFWIAQLSGLRNRYIMWHMDKNNILSGFHPYQVIGVCLYFSVALCVPTEIVLLWWPSTTTLLTSRVWTSQLLQRMCQLVLISSIYHSIIEKIGLGTFMRATYFTHEFLI